MSKESTIWNSLCPCCGKDAYLGFNSVECSNMECKDYAGSKPEEKKEEKPLYPEDLKDLKFTADGVIKEGAFLYVNGCLVGQAYVSTIQQEIEKRLREFSKKEDFVQFIKVLGRYK